MRALLTLDSTGQARQPHRTSTQFDELKRPCEPGHRWRENRAMAGLAPRVSMVAVEATGRRQLVKRSGLAEPAVS
jgi:hypothetical protein